MQCSRIVVDGRIHTALTAQLSHDSSRSIPSQGDTFAHDDA